MLHGPCPVGALKDGKKTCRLPDCVPLYVQLFQNTDYCVMGLLPVVANARGSKTSFSTLKAHWAYSLFFDSPPCVFSHCYVRNDINNLQEIGQLPQLTYDIQLNVFQESHGCTMFTSSSSFHSCNAVHVTVAFIHFWHLPELIGPSSFLSIYIRTYILTCHSQ